MIGLHVLSDETGYCKRAGESESESEDERGRREGWLVSTGLPIVAVPRQLALLKSTFIS